MAAEIFTDMTDAYEAMIDWPKRLAREEPFFRSVFQRFGVYRVVDVACGTGHHAAMFHAWQLRAEGSDLSPQMIDRARKVFGESRELRWVVRGFDEPIELVEPFDAAICVGNSLALAPDGATIERAIREMLAALRTGGVVLVQLLNLWQLPDGPCLWQKCLRTTLPEGEVLILKGVRRCGPKGCVEVVILQPAGGVLRSESVPFRGLESLELKLISLEAGATHVAFFGGYDEQPYDRLKSPDLLMVARK